MISTTKGRTMQVTCSTERIEQFLQVLL